MQKYCSIKIKTLLFGALFLVFALMVSSANAAAIKGGFAVSGRSSSKVAEEPVKERDISLEDTSPDEIFDLDKFFAELEALYEELLAENAIATADKKAEKKSSAPIGIDEVGIHAKKPAVDVPVDFIGAAFGDPKVDVPVDFIGAAFGDPVVLEEVSGEDGMSPKSTIAEKSKESDEVGLIGFGSFSVTKRSARTERDSQGRTVGAGQVIDIIE